MEYRLQLYDESVSAAENSGTWESSSDTESAKAGTSIPVGARSTELGMQERLGESRSKGTNPPPYTSAPININFMAAQPSGDPILAPNLSSKSGAPSVWKSLSKSHLIHGLDLLGPRDEALKRYGNWQESTLKDPKLRAAVRQATDIALSQGFDLEQLYDDHNPSFFTEKGIAQGVARRFIDDTAMYVKNATPNVSNSEGIEVEE